MRNGPHTDLGTFTLLSRQQGVGGLQAWNEADSWFAPPYNPDAIGCIRREADSGEPVVLDLVPFEPGGQVGVETIPDHHDRAVELDVRADQQIPVVLPGQALADALEQEMSAGRWMRRLGSPGL